MELEISHAAIRRGRRTVLEAAAYACTAPAAIAVVGLNGSGKSSLFLQLASMLQPRAGAARVSVDGRMARVAIVPQDPALPGWLRVERVAQLYGTSFPALAAGMPRLHLDELAGRRAGSLSVGQRQTLAAALALAQEAEVTLLDEPFSALDFRRRLGLLAMLRERVHRGGSVMLSSQSAADLAELCHFFVVIRDGRYLFTGGRTVLAAGAAGTDGAAVEERLLAMLT